MYKRDERRKRRVDLGDLLCSQEGLRTDLPITFPIALGSAHPINNQYSDGYYKSTVRMMYAPEDLRGDAYFWNIDADSLFLIYKSNEEVYAATKYRPGDSIIAAETIRSCNGHSCISSGMHITLSLRTPRSFNMPESISIR